MYTLRVLIPSYMNLVIVISSVLLIALVLLQEKDGGLNVSASSSLQAPIERRGSAKTIHIATIVVSCVFVIGCIVSFLSSVS